MALGAVIFYGVVTALFLIALVDLIHAELYYRKHKKARDKVQEGENDMSIL